MKRRKPMTKDQKDQLLPFKGQLEIRTGQAWPWQRVAKESGVSDETLRSARYDLRSVSLATLYDLEKFFRANGVPFVARDVLPEPDPILELA